MRLSNEELQFLIYESRQSYISGLPFALLRSKIPWIMAKQYGIAFFHIYEVHPGPPICTIYVSNTMDNGEAMRICNF
ncbi:hypothetical protein BT69DRAFT_491752 [Atractiella rhizophila]|nr:hypothetical protein BT69DRAFT_491752 [Atractiella rhizophila]